MSKYKLQQLMYNFMSRRGKRDVTKELTDEEQSTLEWLKHTMSSKYGLDIGTGKDYTNIVKHGKRGMEVHSYLLGDNSKELREEFKKYQWITQSNPTTTPPKLELWDRDDVGCEVFWTAVKTFKIKIFTKAVHYNKDLIQVYLRLAPNEWVYLFTHVNSQYPYKSSELKYRIYELITSHNKQQKQSVDR